MEKKIIFALQQKIIMHLSKNGKFMVNKKKKKHDVEKSFRSLWAETHLHESLPKYAHYPLLQCKVTQIMNLVLSLLYEC